MGWSAAVHYEKSNGLLLKSDSGKLWEEAEKKVIDSKRVAAKEAKDKAPFRWGPAGNGRYTSYQKSKGYAFILLLFRYSFPILGFALLAHRGATSFD